VDNLLISEKTSHLTHCNEEIVCYKLDVYNSSSQLIGLDHQCKVRPADISSYTWQAHMTLWLASSSVSKDIRHYSQMGRILPDHLITCRIVYFTLQLCTWLKHCCSQSETWYLYTSHWTLATINFSSDGCNNISLRYKRLCTQLTSLSSTSPFSSYFLPKHDFQTFIGSTK